MKMQEKRELVKRIVPLALAVIIVAGTIFGLLGSVIAKAADEVNSKRYSVSWGKRPQFKKYEEDSYFSDQIHSLTGGETYYVSLSVDIKDNDTSEPIKPVLMLDDCDFTDRTPRKDSDIDQSTSGKEEYQKNHDYTDIKDRGNGTYRYTFEDIKVKAGSNSTINDFDFSVAFYLKDNSENATGDPIGRVADTIDNIKTSSSSSNSWDDNSTSYKNSNDSSSSEAEVLTTPKMIITDFTIPEIVEYGEDFTVSIDFMNNSKVKNMENISMTITPSEGVAIRNGVNKRHYVTIPKRQSTRETFTFKANEKLASEAITLTVKWDYQYKQDGAYKDGTSEEALTITAVPKPEESSSSEDEKGTEGSISSFEILSVIPPDDVYPEEPAYVTVKVINKDHQFDASNVQLTITGDGLLNSGNTEYHGALTHSTQAEIETELQFKAPGTYKLLATVIYEDSVGKDEDKKPIVRINDLQKEFTVVVQESPMGMGGMGMEGFGMAGMDGMGEDMTIGDSGMAVGGNPVVTALSWMRTHLALSIGGGVVLAAAAIAVIVVIRKKKAEKDEDI